MLWDHRPGNNRFAGIVLQEYSVNERKLIGERVNIFQGTALGFTDFRQSLVARRQQSHCFTAATVVEFEPEHFQQMAGLICYYNSTKFHYLYISHDERLGKHLRVMSCIPDSLPADAFTPPIAISAGKPVHLRVEVEDDRLHFAYRAEDADSGWRWLPQQFDASTLSDEASAPGQANFTGAFVGMACQDMSGASKHADFDFFEYHERNFGVTPSSGSAK